jgi:hypothetical protein
MIRWIANIELESTSIERFWPSFTYYPEIGSEGLRGTVTCRQDSGCVADIETKHLLVTSQKCYRLGYFPRWFQRNKLIFRYKIFPWKTSNYSTFMVYKQPWIFCQVLFPEQTPSYNKIFRNMLSARNEYHFWNIFRSRLTCLCVTFSSIRNCRSLWSGEFINCLKT